MKKGIFLVILRFFCGIFPKLIGSSRTRLRHRYYERRKSSLINQKSGLFTDKNGFMSNPGTNRSRMVRFKNQEDKP